MREQPVRIAGRLGVPRVSIVAAALLLSSLTRGAAAEKGGSADATADAGKAQRHECAEAYEKGQELRASEHLLEARLSFTACSRPECPEVLTKDCLRWLDDLEARTPTFAIAVQRDGEPVNTAKVFLDGEALPPEKLGKTLNANPGLHEVRAELDGFEPLTKKVQLLQGQHLVDITIGFESPKPPAAKPLPTTGTAPGPAPVVSSPTPVLTYVLLGVAVVGAGSFATFGTIGHSKQNTLDTCKPGCKKADVDARDQDYLIGDISLAVGTAALIGAGVSYFTRPTQSVTADTANAPKRDLAVTHTASGWGLSYRSTF